MLGALQNAMRLQALRSAGIKITSRLGLVTGYKPNKYAVKVSLQPEGVQTGFIRVAAAWLGAGWGMYAPPSIGDQVAVIFIDGDVSAGFAVCGLFDNAHAPTSVPSGEFWLVHKSGQSVKLTNDGKLTLSDGHGAAWALNGDGTTSVTGPVTFSDNVHFVKDVQVDQTLTADLDVVGGGISLRGHTHLVSGVQTGSSFITTAAPTP